jgi:hypothetical protein
MSSFCEDWQVRSPDRLCSLTFIPVCSEGLWICFDHSDSEYACIFIFNFPKIHFLKSYSSSSRELDSFMGLSPTLSAFLYSFPHICILNDLCRSVLALYFTGEGICLILLVSILIAIPRQNFIMFPEIYLITFSAESFYSLGNR